jgi:hypothetical protein
MKIDSCPRCGRPGYLEEMCVKSTSGRDLCYYRVVHYYKENGKRRKKVCYLGPVAGVYSYVERVHGLGLTNVLKQDPREIVSNVVSKVIELAYTVGASKREEMLGKVRELRVLLEHLAKRLAQVESELKGELEVESNDGA